MKFVQLFIIFEMISECLFSTNNLLRKIKEKKNKSKASSFSVAFTATAGVSLTYFYSQISVGTPSQTVSVNWDTGSCWPVIGACESSTTTGCYTNTYRPWNSNSFVNASTPITLSYGTNSKSSNSDYVFQDTITVSGTTLTGFSMAYNAQSTSSSSVKVYLKGNSNPFGLCYNYTYYQTSATYGAQSKSYVQTLYDAGLIPAKQFAWSYTNSTGTGTLTFGGYDTTQSIVWIPTSGVKEYWEINISSINGIQYTSYVTLSTGAVKAATPKSVFSFIVDTGGQHIDLPVGYHNPTFLDTIPVTAGNCGSMTASTTTGSTTYTYYPYGSTTTSTSISCSCTSLADLNNLVFVINGKTFTLPPVNYAKYADGTCTTFLMWTSTPLLGNVFVKAHYSVFDYDGAQIGFAANGPNTIS
jgi:hypothetical protein